MSKFVDILNRAGQQSPAPLGFGQASMRQKSRPSLALAGIITTEELAREPALGEADVDALVLTMDPWDESGLDGVVSGVGKRPWGISLAGITAGRASALSEKGCDFIICEPETTDAAILATHDLGIILRVGLQLGEHTARGLSRLHVDALSCTLQNGSPPLTVQNLIDLGAVNRLTEGCLVLSIPPGLSSGDLAALRDAGVSGLVVDLSSVEEIGRLRDTIAGLSRPRSRHSRTEAIIPPVGYDAAPASHDHDGEEDDYDDEEDGL